MEYIRDQLFWVKANNNSLDSFIVNDDRVIYFDSFKTEHISK